MKDFKFKQFTVKQEKSAMKVGTDGVLLGAWADGNNAKSILDIGVGTGLIALMMAQRFDTKIIGIEIEKNSYEEAIENIGNSKWKDKIEIQHTSFQEFAKNTKHKFDCIVTNPPYFTNSLKPLDDNRNIARHNDSLSFEELILGVKQILSKNGKFSLIIPFSSRDLFNKIANMQSLFCNRHLIIKPKADIEPKRILMEFSFDKSDVISDFLIIENDKRHDYTNDYIILTKEFYLKF